MPQRRPTGITSADLATKLRQRISDDAPQGHDAAPVLTVVVTRGIVESVALCLVRTPGLRRLPRANAGPWIVGTVVVVVLAGLGQSLRTRGHHRVRTSTARSSAHQFQEICPNSVCPFVRAAYAGVERSEHFRCSRRSRCHPARRCSRMVECNAAQAGVRWSTHTARPPPTFAVAVGQDSSIGQQIRVRHFSGSGSASGSLR